MVVSLTLIGKNSLILIFSIIYSMFCHLHPHRKKALFSGIANLELTETDFEHASRTNPMLHTSKTKNPRRDVFAEALAEKGLSAACRKSRTVKQRVVGFAVKWCPVWVRKVVRKVLRGW